MPAAHVSSLNQTVLHPPSQSYYRCTVNDNPLDWFSKLNQSICLYLIFVSGIVYAMDPAAKRRRTADGDETSSSLHREGEHMTISKTPYDDLADGAQSVTVLYRTDDIRTYHMISLSFFDLCNTN